MRVALTALFCSAFVLACRADESSQNSNLDIVGGENVTASDRIAEHTVALINGSGSTFCTGTLITKNYILTAAHCVLSISGPIFVGFGREATASHLGDLTIRYSAGIVANKDFLKLFSEQEGINHAFQDGLPINDIALIRLNEAAPNTHRPVTLVSKETLIKRGESVVLAGYGLTRPDPATRRQLEDADDESDKAPKEMGVADEEVLTKEPPFVPDNGTLRKVVVPYFLSTASNEVIVGPGIGKAACNGDSGGPAFLAIKLDGEKQPLLVQIGIASRSNCENLGFYTDLREQADWIKSSMNLLDAAIEEHRARQVETESAQEDEE